MKRYKSVLLFLLLVNLLGLGVASYQIYLHYTADGACGIVPGEGCMIADSSIYSKFLGVPVSILGTIWFIVLLVMMVMIYMGDWAMLSGAYVWNLAGAIGVFRFLWAEYVLRTLCVLCTVVHIVIFVSLIVMIFLISRKRFSFADVLEKKWFFIVPAFVMGLLFLVM